MRPPPVTAPGVVDGVVGAAAGGGSSGSGGGGGGGGGVGGDRVVAPPTASRPSGRLLPAASPRPTALSIAPETPPYVFDVDPTTVFSGLVPIGAGASGAVYRAVDTNGRTVAVKRVTPASDAEATALAAEVAMAATTRHGCLLKAWETYVWRGEWWLATEWMDGGSATGLIDAAAAAGARLPERVIAYIVREVLEGLAHMHAGGRMHRDVKSDNVLLEGGGRVALADFGFVAEVGGGGRRTSTVGTPYCTYRGGWAGRDWRGEGMG